MRNICAIALATLLSACACPDTVETKRLGDEDMSCQQLLAEIKQTETARADLSSEKGVTGKNVAAAVFFWPALIVTHGNVNDAMQGLDHRKSHLMEIYNKKNCTLHNAVG